MNKTPAEMDKIYHRLLEGFTKQLNKLVKDLTELTYVAKDSHKRSYLNGFCDGLSEYAIWQNGIRYVGNCRTTLKQATEEAVENGGGITGKNPFLAEIQKEEHG